VIRWRQIWGWTEDKGYPPDMTEVEEENKRQAAWIAAMEQAQRELMEKTRQAWEASQQAERIRQREIVRQARLDAAVRIGARALKRMQQKVKEATAKITVCMSELAERKEDRDYELEELAWRGRVPITPSGIHSHTYKRGWLIPPVRPPARLRPSVSARPCLLLR
jgi:hypothetical protein